MTSFRLPDVYTQFRKQVEGGSKVRAPLEMPEQLNPLPTGVEDGEIPSMESLGVNGESYFNTVYLTCHSYFCVLGEGACIPWCCHFWVHVHIEGTHILGLFFHSKSIVVMKFGH